MNVLFIGRTDNYISRTFIEFFAKNNNHVTALNIQRKPYTDKFLKNIINVEAINLYSNFHSPYGTIKLWLPMLLKSFYPYVLKNVDNNLTCILKNILSKKTYDFVFAWWGIDVIYELSVLFEINSNLPVILYIDAFPTFYNILQNKIEEKIYYRFFQHCSGFIFYSNLMKEIFITKFGKIKSHVLLEPLSESFYSNRKLPKISSTDQSVNIIFTGRTDFDGSWTRIRDDIKSVLKKLEDKKIHIHIHETKLIQESEYLHFYKNFSDHQMLDGTFANYLTQFDGILCIYNEKQNYYPCWQTSLGIRFATSLIAGIPIIVHSSYLSSKEFVESNNFGFSYSDFNSLLYKLYDKSKLTEYENSLEINRKMYAIENKYKDLENFIISCLPVKR